mgnify:CR=1 FL=1
MKQKKRVWMSFNLWEANVFEQYLEEMAAQGWFLESVGGSVMKFHRAEPAKRRYAALLREVLPSQARTAGKQSSSVSSARKPAGILNAAVLSGRFFIRRMMQWSVQGT